MGLDFAEGVEESVAEFRRCVEEAVVRSRMPGVIPNSFGGIEFRRVWREQEYLEIPAVFLEPIIHFRFLVIGCVVLYQEDPSVLLVEAGQQHLLHKGQIGCGIEVVGLMTPDEFGIRYRNGAQYLLCIAFASCRNFRLATFWRPGARQRRGLTERSFVLVDDQRLFF